jgi:hypothetical protein
MSYGNGGAKCDTRQKFDDHFVEKVSGQVLMPIPDAMQLLQTLLYVQKRFSLPEGKDEPMMIEIPQKKN